MLTRFNIKNFATCVDVELRDIPRFAALIGPNGSGKTQILTSIRRFADFTSGRATDVQETFPGRLEMTFAATMKLGERVYVHELKVNPAVRRARRVAHVTEEVTVDGRTLLLREDEKVTFTGREEFVQIGMEVSCLAALSAVLPKEDELNQKLEPLLRFLAGVKYYPLDEPRESRRVGYQLYTAGSFDKRSSAAEDEVAVRLVYLFLKHRTDKFSQLVELAGLSGLGIVRDILVTRVEDGVTTPTAEPQADALYYVRFGPHSTANYVPFSFLSAGTRRALMLLTYFVMDDATLMLIEQPEDALQPGLTTRLTSLLKDNALDTQILVSSHSSALLNRLKPSEVYITGISAGQTAVRGLTATEIEAATEYMHREGTLWEFATGLEGEDANAGDSR